MPLGVLGLAIRNQVLSSADLTKLQKTLSGLSSYERDERDELMKVVMHSALAVGMYMMHMLFAYARVPIV